MALYRYAALEKNGKKYQGVINADSLIVAKELLRKDNILVVNLYLLKDKKKETVIPAPMLIDFTRSLGQLLRAGLPLYESLQTIEEKYRGHRFHPLFLDLCDRLKEGSSLSQAMAQYPKTFNLVYLSMIQVAEQTGSMAQIFEQLTILVERQQKLRKQLVSAMMYPMFLLVFATLVMAILLIFVIPSLEGLFSGRNLPLITRTVLQLSLLLRHHGGIFFLLIASISVGVLMLSKMAHLRLLWSKLLLRMPLIGKTILYSALIRFTRTFASLSEGGVPLIESLQLAKQSMNHRVLQQEMARAEESLLEGKSLSIGIAQSIWIPSMMKRMVSVAEETGKLSAMMRSIADIYAEELDKNLQQFTALLQPVLLLLLGLIVGVVLLSVLVPLTDVDSLF